MSSLFDPLTLRGVTLRNRIGISPMAQFSAKDGYANEWHFVHLGSRAVGGAGLVYAESTAVEPRGLYSPTDLGIWDDKHIGPLSRIAQFIEEQGAVPAIQLGHAGRKAGASAPWEGGRPLQDEEGGWEVVGPSPLAFSPAHRCPHPLSEEELTDIKIAYCRAAERSVAAGFRWIEIHAAHGYLLHSFYSPISNTRTDDYGGSFDNRIRLTLEVTAAVRKSMPDDIPLAVRLSATDWIEGGWNGDDTVALSRELQSAGADLIDLSSGAILDNVDIPIGPGYQVSFADRVRNEVGVPTAAVGMITEPTHADAIIRSGQADIVLIGRESLRNPYWPYHAAQVLRQMDRLSRPNPYLRAS